MSLGLQIDLTGLAATLRHLSQYDKVMYREILDRLKSSADPLAREVGYYFGMEPPLENWHTTSQRRGKSKFPGWQPGKAMKSVKAVVGTRAYKSTETVQLLRIQQMDGAGQIFDSAGSKVGPNNRFVKNLDKHRARKSIQGRYRSRVLFPQTKEILPSIEQDIAKAIESTDALVTKRIRSGD
jgi:hypothetical protein